jgi:hypothetical protein
VNPLLTEKTQEHKRPFERELQGGRELQHSKGRARLRGGQQRTRSGCVAMAATTQETVRVRIELDAGRLELVLFPSLAPLTVANFLSYVDGGTSPLTLTLTYSRHRVLLPAAVLDFTHRDFNQPSGRALQRLRALLPRGAAGQPATQRR